MTTENLIIMTVQPEFAESGLAELQRFDTQLEQLEELAPGILLCRASDARTLMQRAAKQHPVFVRHLAPAQAVIDLTNSEQDIGLIATTIAELPSFTQLERGIHFSIQSRLMQNEQIPGAKKERTYSGGQLNKMLAEAFAEETGAIESIKKPQVVVSILCTSHKGYLGISAVELNLSDWAGGARHYAQTPGQISRAEFKLLEALEVFGILLPSAGHALDLGAAPGGWTHLLLDAGLQVVAVDPANLDPRIVRHRRLDYYRGYAEHFLEEAIKRRSRFDIIVNDMRVDARDAARLLVRASSCLHSDGFIISTLKLPHSTESIDPMTNLKEALNILNRQYDIVRARQLFHNRQEVTIAAARPRTTRR